MERLGRDEIFIIASKLKLLDLLNFCQVTRKIDNNLWIYKLKNELGFDYDEKNPKETYLKHYKQVYKCVRHTSHLLTIYTVFCDIELKTNVTQAHDMCYILMNPRTVDERNAISTFSFIMFSSEESNIKYCFIFFLFSWIAKNLHLPKNHPKFKGVMKKKLMECSTVPLMVKIYEKFSWLLEI